MSLSFRDECTLGGFITREYYEGCKEIVVRPGGEGVGGHHLAQDGALCWAFVNLVIDLWVSQ